MECFRFSKNVIFYLIAAGPSTHIFRPTLRGHIVLISRQRSKDEDDVQVDERSGQPARTSTEETEVGS